MWKGFTTQTLYAENSRRVRSKTVYNMYVDLTNLFPERETALLVTDEILTKFNSILSKPFQLP